VTPEIDIWRAANLMLKRYGDKALEESAARAPMNLRRRTITMARRPGAALPTPSRSSRTRSRLDRCTDRQGRAARFS